MFFLLNDKDYKSTKISMRSYCHLNFVKQKNEFRNSKPQSQLGSLKLCIKGCSSMRATVADRRRESVKF